MLAGSLLVGASCRRNAFGVSAVLAELERGCGEQPCSSHSSRVGKCVIQRRDDVLHDDRCFATVVSAASTKLQVGRRREAACRF